jgi:hypothetical protein
MREAEVCGQELTKGFARSQIQVIWWPANKSPGACRSATILASTLSMAILSGVNIVRSRPGLAARRALQHGQAAHGIRTRLMVSLAGLHDLGPTLFAAFPSSSHKTHFLAGQSLYGSSQIADLGDGRFQRSEVAENFLLAARDEGIP